MDQFRVWSTEQKRPKSGAMITCRLFANVLATVEVVSIFGETVRFRFSDCEIKDHAVSSLGPWRAATRNEIFDWRADAAGLHLDRSDVDGRWDDAVDWLLNLPQNSEPRVQDLFWGIVDGKHGRVELEQEQPD